MDFAVQRFGEVQFLSTPSARRATIDGIRTAVLGKISIHALREEGDAAVDGITHPPDVISIHALREEGDGVRPVVGIC